ncbi:MAG: SWIM zinc finger family protein, partial [Thermodesulfobacteriota bacterium]
MALTTNLTYYFPKKVRQRGYSYYRNGAVKILSGDREEVQAIVIGTRNYEVDLYREKDTIFPFCNCPYFEGGSGPCKHIWAALLSAEERGYLKGKDKADPFNLRIDYNGDTWEEEEDHWEVEEWEDENEERPLRYKASYSPHLERGIALKRSQSAPKWKEPLTSLRDILTTQKEKEEELLKTNRQV